MATIPRPASIASKASGCDEPEDVLVCESLRPLSGCEETWLKEPRLYGAEVGAYEGVVLVEYG